MDDQIYGSGSIEKCHINMNWIKKEEGGDKIEKNCSQRDTTFAIRKSPCSLGASTLSPTACFEDCASFSAWRRRFKTMKKSSLVFTASSACRAYSMWWVTYTSFRSSCFLLACRHCTKIFVLQPDQSSSAPMGPSDRLLLDRKVEKFNEGVGVGGHVGIQHVGMQQIADSSCGDWRGDRCVSRWLT